MVKVLHVIPVGEKGGAEVVVLNILQHLDRSRFTPLVLCLEDGPLVEEIQGTGTETKVINAGRVRQVVRGGKAIVETVKFIRDRGIDLVHSHNAKAHLYGGISAAIAQVPSLYHLHGVPKFTLSRDGIVSLLSVAVPAGRTLACSAYVAETFRQAWRSRRHVIVTHNGVSVPGSTSDLEPSIRHEFGIPLDAPVIVMATRLQRWKGVHVFLDAAVHVLKSQPRARLIVIGGTLFGLEESYIAELHKQVERLELGTAVLFVGFRSDVFRFYSAADLVVHSSIEPEPFGMVLVEAMACGKAVVASNTGGPSEIVEDGVTGLLVPPRDAPQLAQAILSLLADRNRCVEMGRAGAARAKSHFSAQQMVGQLQGMYEQMLAVKNRR